MKHLTKLFLLALFVIVASCQDETLTENSENTSSLAEIEAELEDEIIVSDGEEDASLVLNEDSEIILQKELTFSSFSNSTNGSSPKAIKECKIIDADRSPFGAQQQAANFWWSKDGGNDYFDRSTYFSSTEDNKLVFTEYDNGTANIKGSTVYGTCVVEVNVWLKDKKTWAEWSAIGGEHKFEGTAGDAANKEDLNYYVIDSERSRVTANGGDCVQEGTFGLEQRPDPNDGNTPNYGAHIGPGGANYDSNIGANGLSTWGWLTDLSNNNERLYVIDFNFLLECEDIEECKPCTGKVDKLKLKFDWCRSKRVRVYQKKENTCYGTKVFDKVLQPGEEFTIEGKNRNGTFGKYIYIYINHCYYTKIKTNCYLKIGPGYSKGVFDVISGTSTEGGELCEYVKPDYKCYRHWSCKYYNSCRYTSYYGH